MKKATKESLLAKAQARADKPQYTEYKSKVLGETLLIKRLDLLRICELIDLMSGDSIRENLEVNKQIIYESIPLLQDKELQEAFGCIEPYDIVLKVLDENLGEMQDLCGMILSMYGLSNLGEEIKN